MNLKTARKFKTDTSAFFFIQSVNNGVCPDVNPKIKISKEGYKTKVITVQERTNEKPLQIVLERK